VGKKQIILLEDDDDLRESLDELISLSGFVLDSVSTAKDFHDYMSRNTYDLLLLDIGLPDGNGFDIAREIRSDTDMLIIIMTALDEINDRVKGYECGADIYLVKPIAGEELVAAINSCLERRSSKKTLDNNDNEKSKWHLDKLSWELYIDGENKIKLSNKEASFFMMLIEAEDFTVPREDVLINIYGSDSVSNSVSFDSVLYRLRKKIKNTLSEEFPVKTLHCCGFKLIENIEIIEP